MLLPYCHSTWRKRITTTQMNCTMSIFQSKRCEFTGRLGALKRKLILQLTYTAPILFGIESLLNVIGLSELLTIHRLYHSSITLIKCSFAIHSSI